MESQSRNIHLLTEVVMNIVYWAIEGAYPDYLRHAPITTAEEEDAQRSPQPTQQTCVRQVHAL